MKTYEYLKRRFKEYYKENHGDIPLVSLFDQREFGFIPWDQQIRMIRHMSFANRDLFLTHLKNNGPQHVYSSASFYKTPENQDMKEKGYKGCDFLIDIDVDHFYTPCKEDHDRWYCRNCGKNGNGMVEKCPDCKELKLRKLSWICEDCLDIAKNEIIKLIYDFLIPDFNIDVEKIKIAFSGHRGYHLKIEDNNLRALSSDQRREIINYITGEGISYEILGLRKKGDNIFGFSRDTIGWPQKIYREIETLLKKSNIEIETTLSDKNNFNLSKSFIENLLNYKKNFLAIIKNNDRNNWTLVSSNLAMWNKFLDAIVAKIGIEADVPVSIDTHRLIRYPGSLHGKTGFKVQELLLDELEFFNPLDEQNDKLDPIVFVSKLKTIQKLEIIEQNVPATTIKGETFGPYQLGQKIDVPHHIAIFLLCKGVAKTI
ncbi:MAG: DNA primase small subunit domain-containing protein [Candidatus Thorarchaeota archaeon]